MAVDEEYGERRVRVARPDEHHALIVAASGDYFGTADGQGIEAFDHVDDKAVWMREPDTNAFRHPVTGLVVRIEPAATGHALRAPGAFDGAPARIRRGPAALPSQSLRAFVDNGWVCLPCALDPEVLDGLARVACAGAWSHLPYDAAKAPITGDVAVARAAVEPVSLWLTRQYLRTDDLRLAHSPSLAVVDEDDGTRDLLAWHVDFPYLWGVTDRVGGDRVPVHDSGPYTLAVQRNVCITDFNAENGATRFKLGSHALASPPPEAWGTGAAYAEPGYREAHGLPYGGPEADVVEAPAGSIILYDARTWHRAGVNRTCDRRAALLQAVTPGFIVPFKDISRPYRAFLASGLPALLTERERQDLEALMVHTIVGPEGRFAIGIDEMLTRRTRTGPVAGPGTR